MRMNKILKFPGFCSLYAQQDINIQIPEPVARNNFKIKFIKNTIFKYLKKKKAVY